MNNEIWKDIKGFNRGLDVSQEILTKYNIITAPKSIKLSEIVSKLGIGNSFGIDRHKNLINLYEVNELEFDGEYWQDESYLLGIRDNKIYDSNITLDDRTKWLYTLWIAGTEIIDDLECDE